MGFFSAYKSNLLNAESIRILVVEGPLIRHRIYEKLYLASRRRGFDSHRPLQIPKDLPRRLIFYFSRFFQITSFRPDFRAFILAGKEKRKDVRALHENANTTKLCELLTVETTLRQISKLLLFASIYALIDFGWLRILRFETQELRTRA
jgi:hypothetical protein